jgi:hypothetical protein
MMVIFFHRPDRKKIKLRVTPTADASGAPSPIPDNPYPSVIPKIYEAGIRASSEVTAPLSSEKPV